MVQTIILAYIQLLTGGSGKNSDAAFSLQPQQEAMLYAIAGSQSSQSAYAQALLSLLKGETFSLPVPPDDLSGKTSTLVRKMPKLKQSDLETLQLIPNPAHSHVMVYMPYLAVNSTNELELFNQQGNSVLIYSLSHGQRVAQIDLSTLHKGLYILNVKGYKNLSTKLVIE